MRRRTWVTGAVVGAAVGARALWSRPRRPPAHAVRVATWNLRNFPEPGQDDGRVASILAGLDADIIAVQELRDPDALHLPGYGLHLSIGGGRRGQRLGLALRTGRAGLAAPPSEDATVALDGTVRPAFVASVQTTIGRLDLVVVHLKARSVGRELRRLQWAALVDLVATLAGPVVLLGDFNATGGTEEIAELGEHLAQVGLIRVVDTGGCSAYWEGVRHDGWQEPSLLDLAFVSQAQGIAALDPATAGRHCARHACRPFRSTDAYPDLDLTRASDHCPVQFALAKRRLPRAK